MSRSRSVVAGLLAALALAGTMSASPLIETLSGTILVGEAPAPGVTVIALSATGLRYVAFSNDDGRYSFAELPAGTYILEFEVEGFPPVHRAAQVRTGVATIVDAELSAENALDERMEFGPPSPAMLETHEVRSAFGSGLMDRLPGSRTLKGAALLAAGVSDTGFGFRGRKDYLVISGAPASDSLFLIDGTVVNENVRGQAHSLYIEDAIEEITIISGAVSAEYGRFTGGVVSTLTRSGSNAYSGSFRDSISNPSWSAQREGVDQPNSVHHSLEATLGGRLIADRLWFFGAGRYHDNEQQAFLAHSSIPYTSAIDERRYELKLTGQPALAHSLVASRVSSDLTQRNNCQFGCLEITTVDPETRRPAVYTSARYSGLLRDRVILDAGWSQKDFSFVGFGGETRDPASGSWGYDAPRNAYFGAPLFCGVCDDEQRDSRNVFVKGSYDVSRGRAGTHSLVGGYEQWVEQNLRNNHQSGSDYGIVTLGPVHRDADGTVRPGFEPGLTYITWSPILTPSVGSELVTDSIFLNDRWDLNGHWAFNIGARYDRNHGQNSIGESIPRSGALSPRLAVTYDLRADGRTRVNATYGRYVTKLAGIIGDAASPGGTPAYFAWVYEGPSINEDRSLDTRGAMSQLFEWFFDNGGTGRAPEVSSIPGVTTEFSSSLRPLRVDEWTMGFARQFGRAGFIRVDYVDRNWRDFYSVRTDLSTAVRAAGGEPIMDRAIVENTNSLSRDYRAVQVQGTLPLGERLLVGSTYTYSSLRGNADAETIGQGPRADPSATYPEYRAFEQSNPEGYLPADQRHKFRLWAETNMSTAFGHLSISLLHRFESGTPYEMVADVRPFIANPGYATPPARVPYYFSDRGAFRWDDLSATDAAVNLRVPAGAISLFVRGEVLNLFDNSAQLGGDTTVITAVTSPRRMALFDPHATRPVEGVHFQRGPNFGKPTSIYHLQQPRTLQLSLGLRF